MRLSDKERDATLVVVGSSAGGVEALSTLVATLPADFPAPLVIAQHLDPHRPSHLGEILARQTTLPVHTLIDNEPLTPGTIYVVPSNRHVEITDHHLSLIEDGSGRPKPSINLLFSTAAQVFGEGSIAVVLSGTGSDGTAGALDVKRAGGLVIIQDPTTARYPGMPRSLAAPNVDFVAPISQIGPLLHDLLTGATILPHPQETQRLRAFLRDLHDEHGLDFTQYKTPTILRRLKRRMLATEMTTLDAYVHYLDQHPDEYVHLVSSFLIKVTEFFRDADLFAALHEQVIPSIIAAARQRESEIRLWSAGCATGEEAYSLAMIVADLLGSDLGNFTVRIFATDLDPDAIAFARRGVYPASALTGLPPDLIARYCIQRDGEYEVIKKVRGMLVFGEHDLGQRAPFPRIDLVLCRNVLIYFTTELQKRVLQLFSYALRDDGYLVLGKAETVTPLSEAFISTHASLKIYRRSGNVTSLSGPQIREAMPLRSLVPMPPAALPKPRVASKDTRQTSADIVGELMLTSSIGLVVVNRRYDIQVINSLGLRLFGIQRAALGEDLLHLVDASLLPSLRPLIDAALRGELTTRGELQRIDESGAVTSLDVQAYPHPITDGVVDRVLVLVNDVTDLVRERQRLAAQGKSEDDQVSTEHAWQSEQTRLREHVTQLTLANQQLRSANQELALANITLHQANQEYLVSSEESQAASEEVETLNEEFQATNEELETLNEELQSTVEELNTTNDDLEGQSRELQHLAQGREEQRRASDTERARLLAIVNSMSDSVLVIDAQGKIVLTNAAYTAMLEDHALDVLGEAGTLNAPDEQLQQRAMRGEAFRLEFQSADQAQWFEALGEPVLTEGVSSGGVVVIRDITDRSVRRLQDQFLALASHELRTPLTVLQMALQRLLRLDLPSASRQYADLALYQVQRLERLTTDLTEVSRIQTGRIHLEPQRIDLVELLRRTVAAAQLLTTQPIVMSITLLTVWINGDRTRLEQLFFNLLINASKYASESPEITVCLRKESGQAVVEVHDAGPGIPADELPHLFTRFYQGQSQEFHGHSGLGLGLFISHEVAVLHGGTLTVRSEGGQGTTFTLALPLLPAESQSPEEGK